MTTVTRGTVLVVDDAPAMLTLLATALEEAGYRVLIATDGGSALALLGSITPDAILLDVLLPDMNGFDVCRQMQGLMHVRHVPILFITGLSDAMDIERAFGEGAVDYIVKPVDERELLARLSAHIAQALSIRRTEASMRALGGRAVMCGRDGEITWSTGSAKAMLDGLLGDSSTRKQLPAAIVAWLADCTANINMNDPACGGTMCFKQDHPEGRLHLHYAGSGVGDEQLLILELERHRGPPELQTALALTQREAEVLYWVAQGKTNRDVAEILGLSPKTVNKHLEHLFVKLGVETRSAATARALAVLGQRRESALS